MAADGVVQYQGKGNSYDSCCQAQEPDCCEEVIYYAEPEPSMCCSEQPVMYYSEPESVYYPEQASPYYSSQMNCCSYPCDDTRFYFGVDFLYWSARQDELAYAVTSNIGTDLTPPISGKTYYLDFQWSPGFRIGAGVFLSQQFK